LPDASHLPAAWLQDGRTLFHSTHSAIATLIGERYTSVPPSISLILFVTSPETA